MPRYNEFSINKNYFKHFLSDVTTDPCNVTYDAVLVDSMRVSFEVMSNIHFEYAGEKVNIHKNKINSKEELYAAVSKSLNDSHHPTTPEVVASLYAVALSRYYLYQKWFVLLGHPIDPHKESVFTINFTANNNLFDIQLTQKELKIGEYTEGHLSLSTVLKVRQKIHLDSSTKKITSADDIAFNVSTVLWDTILVKAANDYLQKMSETFSENDILVITPFLLNQDFLNAYSKKYAKQTHETQALARNAISEFYSSEASEKILLDLKPFKVDPPHPPSAPLLTAAPTPTTEVSEIKITSPAPPTSLPSLAPQPVLSPEAYFNETLETFKTYVKFENYQVLQAHYLVNLEDAINNLSQKERKQHFTLLADVMKNAKTAVEKPTDTDNLNACIALLEPLKKSNMRRVACAFTAIILGAIIVATSVAVTLASFGVTSLPALFGISIGTTLLTKGIAIASSVLGLGVTTVGLRLFSHRPYKPIIDNLKKIDTHAREYNARPAIS